MKVFSKFNNNREEHLSVVSLVHVVKDTSHSHDLLSGD